MKYKTYYSGPTTCMNSSYFNLIHHLHYLSHACTLITQPTTTTDNVPYRTPKVTPIDLVHTHHVTSSRVQIVVLHYKLHHVSMSSLSCPMGHCASIIITAMEQGFHSGGQILDHSNMAPCCSIVQGIASFLQKERGKRETPEWYRSGRATLHV